jgi:sugar phosphate isomerase/epimerase
MRFAICNEIYQEWKIEDVLAHAARTGYDAVEIAPFTLAPKVTDVPIERRRQIRDLAAAAGIAISGIHWVLVKAEGMHLTHSDETIRRRTARYFVDLVDFCADLGGGFMVVGSPKQRSLEGGVTPEQGWEYARQEFRDAVRRAEDRRVTICFEPLAPAETNFINTAADAIRFAQAVGSPAMKIILDVKAMCAEAKPIPEIIRESWPHFAYFHANDRNLKGPGFGDVDFVPIAGALREVGYAGYVSVEVFKFEEGANAIATRSLEYLKRVFGSN